MSAQSWLNEIWYGGAPPPWWLMPLSVVYGAVSATAPLAYASACASSTRLPRPVIVVGNLTVGGTGKTPLVCWLAGQLANCGFKPGVVTRGYGGSSPGGAAGRSSPMIRRWSAMKPILLARRSQRAGRHRARSAGSRAAADQCRLRCHRERRWAAALRPARDCEIVVIDGDRRFGNGRLLPAGPLRESPARLRGADAIVVNGGDAQRSTARCACDCWRTERRGDEVTADLQTAARICRPSGARDRRNRQSAALFRHAARARHRRRCEHPLPDHAQLRIDDISFADDLPVLMTEKDAVKCARYRRAATLVRSGQRHLRAGRCREAARHRGAEHCRSAPRAREEHYG